MFVLTEIINNLLSDYTITYWVSDILTDCFLATEWTKLHSVCYNPLSYKMKYPLSILLVQTLD